MGTKSNPGAFDCHAAALPDETVFTLLGRDPALPATVRFWMEERTRLGKNESPDDVHKLVEAAKAANTAEGWRNAIVEQCDLARIPYPWKLPRPAKALGEDRPVRMDPTRPGNRALDAASFMLDALDHPLVRKTLNEIMWDGTPPVQAPPMPEAAVGLLRQSHEDQMHLRAKIVVGLNQVANDLAKIATAGPIAPDLDGDWSPAERVLLAFVDRINGHAAELGDGLPVDMLPSLQPDPERGADTSHATVAVLPESQLAHDLLDDGDAEPAPEGEPVPEFLGMQITVPAETARRMIEQSGQDEVELLCGHDVSLSDVMNLEPRGYRFDRMTGDRAYFVRDQEVLDLGQFPRVEGDGCAGMGRGTDA